VANLDPAFRSNGRVHSAAFYRAYGEQQTKETGADINQYVTKKKVEKTTVPKKHKPTEIPAINVIQQINTKSHIQNIYLLQEI
jgi:hypothetical protein